VRLPPNTNDEVDEDPTGNKALWDRGLLNGASQKVRLQKGIKGKAYAVPSLLLSLEKQFLVDYPQCTDCAECYLVNGPSFLESLS
jgi:splicing factor 3B subunit 3